MLLFANYKTFSVAVDDKGKKRKAQGGERVMYTAHHACWDAKNRYGLPNYKTFSVAVDDKGKKRKAQGGERVMYTAHHACWDAKNRYGLPEELPFTYDSIAHVISNQTVQAPPVREEGFPGQIPPEPKKETPKQEPVSADAGQQMSLPLDNSPSGNFPAQDPEIPKALRDLMEANHVDEWDIQNVVAARGYYPADVRIRDYDKDFIDGLIKERSEKPKVGNVSCILRIMLAGMQRTVTGCQKNCRLLTILLPM